MSEQASAELRDRIRRACAEADGFRFEGLEPHDYQKHADAMLTIFAAPVVLTAPERQFLTFALDLAFDRMVSDDGFTDEDEAALKRLRLMTTTPDEQDPHA